MSWSSRKEDRRDICTLVKENQGNNLVTPRNHWNETFYLYFFYICVSGRIIFFLTEIFFHLVWCQGCRGETAAGAYLPGCVENIIYFIMLYCATLLLSLHFYVFFRYCYQFSSLSGVSILGRAIVAIAGSGLILIRLTVVYIIFCRRHFLVSRSAK